LVTIGYQYIEPFMNRTLKIHDTVSVQSLHGLTGLIAALLGAIFAACATKEEYGNDLLRIYPARIDDKRNGIEQAGFQLIGLLITIGVALVTGALTGLFLRLPFFEQLSEDVEMFDDEAQWVTPDDYALKLTFASNNQASIEPQVSPNAKKEDSKV